MRVLQNYQFVIGTKIPFSEFPGIAVEFLEKFGLHYQRLDYYFESYGDGCVKAVQDCPNLGPVRLKTTEPEFVEAYLTNCDGTEGCDEQTLMKLMPKIYRRYGFSETCFFYRDVNFFPEAIPAVVSVSEQPSFCGSGIMLYRDRIASRWNWIKLSVDVLFPEKVYDASHYRDTMAQMLPGAHLMEYMEVAMEPQEQAEYDRLNAAAKPLLERAEKFLLQAVPHKQQVNAAGGYPGVGRLLRKAAKAYGFSASKTYYHMTILSKQINRGHYLLLDVDYGRMGDECNVGIHIQGLGFDHLIGAIGCVPQDAEQVSAWLNTLFEALEQAEQCVLLALAEHFPSTPDWYQVSK